MHKQMNSYKGYASGSFLPNLMESSSDNFSTTSVNCFSLFSVLVIQSFTEKKSLQISKQCLSLNWICFRFLYMLLINWIKIECCWKQISREKTRGLWARPVHKCIAELQKGKVYNCLKKMNKKRVKKPKYNTQRWKKTNCNRSPVTQVN